MNISKEVKITVELDENDLTLWLAGLATMEQEAQEFADKGTGAVAAHKSRAEFLRSYRGLLAKRLDGKLELNEAIAAIKNGIGYNC